MDDLYFYIQYRSNYYEIEPSDRDPKEFFIDKFLEGVRKFFGVYVDDDGQLLDDEMEPELLQEFLWKKQKIENKGRVKVDAEI